MITCKSSESLHLSNSVINAVIDIEFTVEEEFIDFKRVVQTTFTDNLDIEILRGIYSGSKKDQFAHTVGETVIRWYHDTIADKPKNTITWKKIGTLNYS